MAAPSPRHVAACVVAVSVTGGQIINTTENANPFTMDEDQNGQMGFLLPRSLTERIVMQSGVFSFHPNPSRPWRNW